MAHRHRACEITCIRKGTTVYELRGREYPLSPGDVLVIGELEGHHWREQGDDEGAKTVILLDPPALGWPGKVPSGALQDSPEAVALVDRIVAECAERRPGFRTVISAAVQRILSLAASASVSPSAVCQHGMAWMRSHAPEPITVPDVADACGVSPSYLRELWKREFGCSPLRSLREIRTGNAAALLHQTGMPVSEVASAVGYGSLSAFERAFRAVWACSPRDYARRYGSPASRNTTAPA